MKLESSDTEEIKALWKVVRTDDYTDIPGMIVTADEATGICSLTYRNETKTMNFGPNGIRITWRKR